MAKEEENQSAARNRLTCAEVQKRISELSTVFDLVRLVDPISNHRIVFDAQGKPMEEKNYCFCIWQRNSRCTNCVSAQTLSTKKKTSKFEFIDKDMFLLVANYVEVDGKPYVLENILHIDDETLVGAYGKSEFVKKITYYNKQIFNDSLTGVHNRRYYDDQVSGLPVQAAAMIDIDHFKTINDTWYHKAGDAALRAAAQAISSCIRKTDILLRYGGDEFLLAFEDIPREVFHRKLASIHDAVEHIVVPGYPEMHLTLSIGGTYQKGALKDIMAVADQALYEAKARRNHIVIRD